MVVDKRQFLVCSRPYYLSSRVLPEESMIYTVSSSKSLNEIDQTLREAAQSHKFGILNVLDIRQTLSKKGIEIGRECRIYDVCNPQAASEALAPNMGASAVLPCRISVFSEGDKTILATVKPTDLL
jgi:uncharacterized protein (DUF302 family)